MPVIIALADVADHQRIVSGPTTWASPGHALRVWSSADGHVAEARCRDASVRSPNASAAGSRGYVAGDCALPRRSQPDGGVRRRGAPVPSEKSQLLGHGTVLAHVPLGAAGGLCERVPPVT